MHMALHPSQWFHHETAPHTEHRLRTLLHDGAFWATVILTALVVGMFVLALMLGDQSGLESGGPYFLP
jgi:multisubunit Na+/H+ antiporter MnhC subunit